nr:MAG TPA: hypothetical protein [Caudoviricetes sp.]
MSGCSQDKSTSSLRVRLVFASPMGKNHLCYSHLTSQC